MQELSAKQAGKVIGLSHTMIHRYVNRGLLPARRVGRMRAIRIQMENLREFARKFGYDFDEELASGMGVNGNDGNKDVLPMR